MTIKRGKRRSIVLETERWRFRLVIGRFRRWWAFEHERHNYGEGGVTGLVTSRFFLLSFRQSGYRKTPAAHPGQTLIEIGAFICLVLVGVGILIYLTT